MFGSNEFRDSFDDLVSFELVISSYRWSDSELIKTERYQQKRSQTAMLPFLECCRDDQFAKPRGDSIQFHKVVTHLLWTPSRMEMWLEHFFDEGFKLYTQGLPDRNNRGHPLDVSAPLCVWICLCLGTQTMHQLNRVDGAVNSSEENCWI